MKSWHRFTATLLAATFAPLVFAQEDTEKPAKDQRKPADPEEAVLSDIPLGQPMSALVIPQRGEDGKLLSLFRVGTAKRVDDKHIEMTDLKIEIHNEDGTTFHVQMPEAVFDLETRVLKSSSPTQIRREGFVIDGDAAEFFTKTRFGRMTGNVKMIIDSDDIE